MASALQLRRIIEDMLNLRYLKQSEAELQRDNVEINWLIDDIRKDIETLAMANGHKLEIKPAPEGTRVFIDPTRMSMALTNLINNAVRFTTDPGKINIDCEVRNNNEVWIAVTDTGIGLEQDQLEKIFEEFYQVEDHMTRRHGGLGIGLSITRALVGAHGGRVWAASPGLGKGSTFTVALPLVRPPDI
jgi:signal transduction histidine kinase